MFTSGVYLGIIIVSSAAKMWIMSNPEIVAKQAKSKQAKERAWQRKHWQGVAERDLGRESRKKWMWMWMPVRLMLGHPKRRLKRCGQANGRVDLDTDDDANKPLFTISAYIHILWQTAPTAPPKPCTKKPEDEYLQCGSFQVHSTDTYDDFLHFLAQTLPCPSLKHITSSKITWKPQKPLKAEALPLGNSLGFFIVINELASKPSHVIILMMPPPAKPIDGVPVHC